MALIACLPAACPLLLQDKITLIKQATIIPEQYELGQSVVVPMWAGQEVPWRVA